MDKSISRLVQISTSV